jgi:hypothetical protein
LKEKKRRRKSLFLLYFFQGEKKRRDLKDDAIVKPPKGFVWASFVNGEEREDSPAVGATHAEHGAERERASWLTSVYESGRVFDHFWLFHFFLSLGSFSKNKKNFVN